MTKDGFNAVVKINRIEICTGFSSNRPRTVAEIEMDGYIREDTELNYNSLKGKKETSVYVHIEFDDNPDYSEYSYDQDNGCIGELSVSTDCDTDINAYLRIILKTEIINSFIALKDHYIAIDPIFFRKTGEIEKCKENNRLIRYIERIYFEPYIE